MKEPKFLRDFVLLWLCYFSAELRYVVCGKKRKKNSPQSIFHAIQKFLFRCYFALSSQTKHLDYTSDNKMWFHFFSFIITFVSCEWVYVCVCVFWFYWFNLVWFISTKQVNKKNWKVCIYYFSYFLSEYSTKDSWRYLLNTKSQLVILNNISI